MVNLDRTLHNNKISDYKIRDLNNICSEKALHLSEIYGAFKPISAINKGYDKFLPLQKIKNKK